MMRASSFWWKARKRQLWYRRRQVGITFIIGLLLSASSLGLALLHSSSQQAVESAVRADLGNFAYAYGTGVQEMAERLSTAEGVFPVRDESATASQGPFETPVTLRTTRDSSLHLGQLLEGRFASKPVEATVSVAIATDLNLSIGQTLVVTTDQGEQRITCVGLTGNSADIEDRVMVTVNSELGPGDATQWLSNREPEEMEVPLLESLNIRTSSVTSAGFLVEQRRSELPRAIAALRYLPIGLACLWFALLVATVVVFLPPLASDVKLLTQAGVARAQAWRSITRIGLLSLMLGEALGAALIWIIVRFWRADISALFGQRWLEVPGPWPDLTLLVLVTVAGVVIVPPVARALAGLRVRATSRAGKPIVVLALGALGVALWIVAWKASLQTPAQAIAARAPVGLALIAVVLPTLVATPAMVRLRPASKALGQRLAKSFVVVASVSVVAACVSGSYASKGTHNANANEARSGVLQPAGSFVAYDLSAGAAESLRREYRRLGGRDMSEFVLPDESDAQLRVTSVGLVECLEEAGTSDPNEVDDDCFPQNTFVPVNTILLSPSAKSIVADPALISDGMVGVLRYRTGSAEVTDMSTVQAVASSRIGGNIGGLVVPIATAESEFGVSPSLSTAVAFWDFSGLSEQSQARFRGSVSRLAPSAQTADGESGSGYDRQRSIATAAAQGGAAVTFLVLLLGGLALALGERTSLRALADMGASPGRRRSLAGRVVAVPAASLLIGLLITIPTTQVAGTQLPGSDGRWWILPFVSGLLACLVVWVLLIRVPRRIED